MLINRNHCWLPGASCVTNLSGAALRIPTPQEDLNETRAFPFEQAGKSEIEPARTHQL